MRSSLSKDQLWSSHSLEPQNPSFDLGYLELGWFQAGFEEFCEAAVEISGAHPGGDRIGVLLVGVTSLDLEASAPQPRINHHHHRLSARNVPAVERPKMDPAAQLLAEVTQPRKASVGGLGYGALNVEVKDRLGPGGIALPSAVASAHCRLGRRRYRIRPHARSPRRYGPRGWANTFGSHQGTLANQAKDGILRNNAPGMGTRDRFRPASVGLRKAAQPASHSAMPRCVQHLRGPSGGCTSTGGDALTTRQTLSPFRLDVGVCAPE